MCNEKLTISKVHCVLLEIRFTQKWEFNHYLLTLTANTNVGEVLEVHETFLELHSKNSFTAFSLTAEVDGNFMGNHKMAPYSLFPIPQTSSVPVLP